eukprot:14277619-Ditylum_brightwellii.AAC.1
MPNEEGSEEDGHSIPSIESLNEVAIHHNTDDFEPSADITDTTTAATSGDNETSVATEESLPEEEGSADDTMTAGVYTPDEDINEDSSFTTGVIMQDNKETSSSPQEEVNEAKEDVMMEKTLHVNIDERDVQ